MWDLEALDSSEFTVFDVFAKSEILIDPRGLPLPPPPLQPARQFAPRAAFGHASGARRRRSIYGYLRNPFTDLSTVFAT